MRSGFWAVPGAFTATFVYSVLVLRTVDARDGPVILASRGERRNRLPHSNTSVLTPDGQRVAIFYTKVHNRLLRCSPPTNDQHPNRCAKPCAS